MKKTNLLFTFLLLLLAVQYGEAQYCSAGPTSTADSNMGLFTLTGSTTNISYTPPCPGVTGVNNQTALSADVAANSTYNGTVTWGTCGGNFGNAGTIWVDFNKSNTFDAGEAVHTWTGTPTVANQAFSFTVPGNSVNGATRLRVMQRESGSLPLDPCSTYSWGSVTDFTVVISGGTGVPPPPMYCTGGPTSTADSNMGLFTLTGQSTNISYTPPCPGLLGLNNQTALSANAIVGSTYSGTVTWGSCGGNFGNAGTIWVDFNQDAIFDATEAVHTWTGTPTVANQAFSFTVPGTAALGTTRIRVQQQEGGTLPLDACASFSWGSKTDFSLVINPIPVCNPPTNISVTDIMQNTAVANFNSNGQSTNLELTGGGAGQGSGTIMAGVTSPYTIIGLTPGTSYEIWLQNSCTNGLSSSWAGPFAFTTATPPPPPVVPTISMVDANGDGNADIIDPCACSDPENVRNPTTNEVTYFHDFVTIVSNPGETWNLTAYNSGQMYDAALVALPVNTNIPEVTPGVYHLDFFHASVVGFNANFNRTVNPLATPLNASGSCDGVACAAAAVPTMGQWGMILFTLIMLSFGVVFVMRKQVAFAGMETKSSSFSSGLPFNKSLFGKVLMYVMLGLALTFMVAVTVFGYEMTNADVPGSLFAGPALAYLIHLVMMAKKEN